MESGTTCSCAGKKLKIMDKKEIDSQYYVKMSSSDFYDLQNALELSGFLVKIMQQIYERVQKNFEKMWEICCNTSLMDKNDGNK